MKNKKINVRKQRILDAAIKVFTTKGFKDATVREIAATASLTTGAIYHHYKNKNELLYDAINYKIHFIHNLSEKDGSSIKSPDLVLEEVQDKVIERLSQLDEQKLHILLLADVISQNDEMLDKYKDNYDKIIEKVGNMYLYAFDIENEEYKRYLASIFVAALDGMAIQSSLGLTTEEKEKSIKVFIDFFTESIPAFLNKHK